MEGDEAYQRLADSGIRPSLQRLEIMRYLLSHRTHPTVEDVYKGLCGKIHTLSRTTVYNTLRMFYERHAAQMITIDEHRVCYDGDITPHVHFFCTHCGRVFDMAGAKAPASKRADMGGFLVEDTQLYYRGICPECRGARKEERGARNE